MGIDTAMVFCAGLGTRMRPLTDDKPKAMVEVAGKPLLYYRLKKLCDAGVKRVVINTHYKPEPLLDYIQTIDWLDIQISHEPELLDTGGGLKQALPLLDRELFYVLNCDMIWHENTPLLPALENAYDGIHQIIMAMIRLDNAHGYEGNGDFNLSKDGSLSRNNPTHVFGGIQLMHRDILSDYDEKIFSLSKIFKEKLGHIKGVELDGKWHHIDTPTRVEKFNS